MKLRYLFAALCLCLLLASPAAAAGGSGTAANPYVIQTPAELQSIQNNLAAYYVLGNDIDLQGYSFSPIGSSSAPFTGSLDGNGKTISNLYISSNTANTGFFGVIGSGVTIKDIIFTDCTVSSTSTYTGIVSGSISMSSANNDLATLNNVDCVRCTVSGSGDFVGTISGFIYTHAVVDIIDYDVSYAVVECTSGNNVGAISNIYSADSVEIIRGSVSNSIVKGNNIIVGAIGRINNVVDVSITDTIIKNCIFEASNGSVGVIGYVSTAGSINMVGVDVQNCVIKGLDVSGGLFGLIINSGVAVSATSCTVTDSTIIATRNYAGGIAGRVQSGATGIFTDCTVTGCTILATSYAATICPAFS